MQIDKPLPRVLAFGCHPDDIEFMAAGTLALLARLGCEIHMAVMAGGEVGSPKLPPQKIREQRLQEAAAAAAVIGATFHYAGGHDLEVEYNADYRKRTVRIVRDVDPAIVLAPPPADYLIDHEETSRLVRNAAFIAPVPNYDCGVVTRPASRIPHLYYWNASGLKDIFGRPLPLTCAVNIAAMMEIKTRMLLCHASQREWLQFINGWDEYAEIMKRMSQEEGRRAGLPYAEGFIQHLGSGHPADNVLATLLGDLCVPLPLAGRCN
jgi:LmbE family N-acetylglucosaminyl deacetylase